MPDVVRSSFGTSSLRTNTELEAIIFTQGNAVCSEISATFIRTEKLGLSKVKTLVKSRVMLIFEITTGLQNVNSHEEGNTGPKSLQK
jgi:hypothetical protein